MAERLTRERFREYLFGWLGSGPGSVMYLSKENRWLVRRFVGRRHDEEKTSDVVAMVRRVVPTAHVHAADKVKLSHHWVEFAVDLDHVATIASIRDVMQRGPDATETRRFTCCRCGYVTNIGGLHPCRACNSGDDDIRTAGIVVALAGHSKRTMLDELNRLTGCDHGRPQDWTWVEAARLLASTMAEGGAVK